MERLNAEYFEVKEDTPNPVRDGRRKYGIESVRTFKKGTLVVKATYRFTYTIPHSNEKVTHEEVRIDKIGEHNTRTFFEKIEENVPEGWLVPVAVTDGLSELSGADWLREMHINADEHLMARLIDDGHIDREKIAELWEELGRENG